MRPICGGGFSVEFFDLDDFDVRDRIYQIEDKCEKLRLYQETLSDEERTVFENLSLRAFVYHDSALDGLVISNEELASVFTTYQAQHYTKNRVWQEIKNHEQALRQIVSESHKSRQNNLTHQCKTIRFDDVIAWHVQLFDQIPKKKPGVLRNVVPLHLAYFHEIIAPEQIEARLSRLCSFTENPEFRAQHAINQAILFHNEFMRVFPFLEGSGKVGRLLMNSFLLQGGYRLAVIHGSERQSYYETLRDGPEKFRELVLDSLDATLEAEQRTIKRIGDFMPQVENNRRVVQLQGEAVY